MMRNDIPPYTISKKDGRYIVESITTGLNFRVEEIGNFDTFSAAKDCVKTHLQDDKTYDMWKEYFNYQGTEEDILNFCCYHYCNELQ